MCYDTSFDGNKVAVCQVDDLVPGQTFRTPERHTLMVLDLATDDGYSLCATETGAVIKVGNNTNLGHDRAGRLYASRYLNPSACITVYQPVN